MKNKRKNKNTELSFSGQHDGEEVIFVFRKHIIAMRKGFVSLLICLGIGCIPPLIWQDKLEIFLSPLIGLGIGLFLFFYYFIMWYFSVYIVTNERIRQVTQHSLFGSDVVEVRLSNIHNISYNIPGISGYVFKFGTLVIQTYVGDLIINTVDHPSETYNKLQDIIHKLTSNKVQREGEYEEN